MARHLLLCGAVVLCLCFAHVSADAVSSVAASPELSKALAEHNSTLEDSWATVLAATLLSNNNGTAWSSVTSKVRESLCCGKLDYGLQERLHRRFSLQLTCFSD